MSEEEFLRVFSRNLKTARVNNGLSQKEAAHKLRISASLLSTYERGLRNPSISVVKRFAEFYNVSIDTLCGIKHINKDTFHNYGEIISILVEIMHTPGVSSYLAPDDIIEYAKNSPALNFQIKEKTLYPFFSAWNKMYTLCWIEKSIPESIYNSWLNGEMEKYSKIQLPQTEEEIKAWLENCDSDFKILPSLRSFISALNPISVIKNLKY